MRWEDQNVDDQFFSKYKKEIKKINDTLSNIKKHRKKDPENVLNGFNLSKYVDLTLWVNNTLKNVRKVKEYKRNRGVKLNTPSVSEFVNTVIK